MTSNRNLVEAQAEYEQQKEKRKKLKRKLLSLFAFSLFMNAVNLIIYLLADVILIAYFVELSYLSASGLATYITLNCKLLEITNILVYLLDVLRDGVLMKIKTRERDNEVTELSSVHLYSTDHEFPVRYSDGISDP
jgi:hypothetical protein